ncbi:MAG: toprim domain-containing protein, partial [Pirellulaceae bacterium]
ASFGHIRDLPSKNNSVRPEEDFALTYEVDEGSERHIKEIIKNAKEAERIILATDPDREGEAISWHVLEVLKQRKAIKKDTKIERISFNSITKDAVLEAMKKPRDID